MANLAAINLNRLLVFVTVVEAGSITAAATRLGLAKTMVSAHIQRLEHEVGVSLLLRTTRRLGLTEAGEAFYDASRRIVREIEAAVDDAAQEGSTLRGSLRITAPIDYGAAVIAPVCVALRQRHPELKIELLAGDRMFDLVGEGIDVAIRLGVLPDSNHQAVRIGGFDHVLVASPALLQARPALQQLADLADWPFIALSVLPQPLSWTFTRGDAQHTQRFAAGFGANTAYGVRAAALAGGGLAMLPDFAVRDDLATGRLQPVLPQWQLPRGGIYAVFPAARHRPRKVQVLVEALREQVTAEAGNTALT
ncbi:DNA-binding transcriptional regulator, LysR family [Andreprevotia lacus DSM 23236]|jgi:DNA-binding transcriptional LysR family regulator|uniref:DNA-binding transcriptional regulator, LysR family n=1 Tax=Andreprevotia lacus DSM 23236 TaxID=1121001 RepID=A0A1W1XAF1_9NEIS|nr:LysR family transcriptional regulator [Andreprevotia lacus]SMC20820.1 DNA-binding transcriptional regulator, LysR family [Andreprevotia lacus DSM 23236]